MGIAIFAILIRRVMIKKMGVMAMAMLLSTQILFAWGKTGHRAIGEVAEAHLTKKARKKIHKLLDGKNLAMVANWMDDIKSDDDYRFMSPWHYANIPAGESYETSEKNEQGDLIITVERIITELESGAVSDEKAAEGIKILTHLIGDFHQPFHLGYKKDLGGNLLVVSWFGRKSNIHRVWDSQMVDGTNLSYTELAKQVDLLDKAEVKQIQQGNIRTWIPEIITLRDEVYQVEKGDKLGYQYQYEHFDQVEMMIRNAGLRLAAILNQIYG